MSVTLTFVPVKIEKDFAHGSTYATAIAAGIYTEENLDYLLGMRAGGMTDVDELIEAIRRHGEVIVRHNY